MTASSIEQLVRAQVEAGVEAALKPYLRRLSRPEKRTYSFAEAADVIGCSDRHVAKLVAAGHLPLVPHLGTRRLIPRVAVERFVDGASVSHLGGAGADVTSISTQDAVAS